MIFEGDKTLLYRERAQRLRDLASLDADPHTVAMLRMVAAYYELIADTQMIRHHGPAFNLRQ